jgi:hypothetical protein
VLFSLRREGERETQKRERERERAFEHENSINVKPNRESIKNHTYDITKNTSNDKA